MRDLNSSVVSAETIVGGKSFKSGIVQGKNNILQHRCTTSILYTVYSRYPEVQGTL